MEGKTLLLVEDEALIAIAQKKTLEKYGYRVVTATSGQKAIEKMRTGPGIDLILMDINLGKGKMDGTETAEIILKEKDVPVIFLSSYTQQDIVEKTEKITSYGYVVKDSGETVLNASIKMAFKLYEARRDLQEQKEVLKRGQDEYFNILNVSPVPLALFDENNLVSYLNPAFVRVFGYTRDDLPTVDEWWPLAYPDPDYREAVIAGWRENLSIMKTGNALFKPMEVNIRCKDGTGRTVVVEAASLTAMPETLVAIFYDITELKNTKIQLEEELTRRRVIFEQAPYGVVIIDPETAAFPEFNTMVHAQLGYTREEFARMRIFDIDAVESPEVTRQRIAGVMATGQGDFETVQRTKSGELRNIHVTARTVNAGSQPLYYCIWRDITEDKKREAALRESESRAKAMLDAIPDIMFRMDSRGVVLDYKAEEKDLHTGSTPITGRRIRDITPSEFADLIEREIGLVLGSGSPRTFEYQLSIPDSGVRDYEARMAPSGVQEVIAIVRDITERKKIEEALQASRTFYESMNELAVLHEVVRDETGNAANYRILDCNRAFTDITGIPREEVLGKLATDVYGTKEAPYLDIYSRVASTGEPARLDEYFAPMDKHFSISVSCPKKGHFVTVATDITEHRRAEDQVRALLSEKELLLQEVHHRVKNNMVTVMGLLSLQSETVKDPLAVSAFENTRDRIRSMAILYEKLYRSSDFRNVSARTYLPALISAIADNFPNRRDVTIEARIEDRAFDSKILSPVGIIINELITNAMKYAFTDGQKGKITVSFSTRDSDVLLTVEDNGTGLPEAFEMDDPKGFGMRLVTILTEQLDGSLRFERGNGTRFVLEFKV